MATFMCSSSGRAFLFRRGFRSRRGRAASCLDGLLRRHRNTRTTRDPLRMRCHNRGGGGEEGREAAGLTASGQRCTRGGGGDGVHSLPRHNHVKTNLQPKKQRQSTFTVFRDEVSSNFAPLKTGRTSCSNCRCRRGALRPQPQRRWATPKRYGT